jgi:nucleotide-binding universal stress UspA family protein
MYTRIIVALDGSALAEQILPYVQSVAERFGSTLTLVRAIPPVAQMTASVGPAMAGVPLDPSMIEQTLRTEEFETTQYLEHVANELGRPNSDGGVSACRPNTSWGRRLRCWSSAPAGQGPT